MCETDGWIDDNNTLKTPSELSKDKLLGLIRTQKRDCDFIIEDTMMCTDDPLQLNMDEDVFEMKNDGDNYTSSHTSIGSIDAFLNNIKEKSQHNSSVIGKVYKYKWQGWVLTS